MKLPQRDRLNFFIARRIFLVGPPGSNRKENALALGEYFNWQSISVGDLLKKEVGKKSEYGKAIVEAQKDYRYGKYTTRVVTLAVDDNIVIDLVKKQIANYEKDNQSWIIEGFPRTKVQALSL